MKTYTHQYRLEKESKLLFKGEKPSGPEAEQQKPASAPEQPPLKDNADVQKRGEQVQRETEERMEEFKAQQQGRMRQREEGGPTSQPTDVPVKPTTPTSTPDSTPQKPSQPSSPPSDKPAKPQSTPGDAPENDGQKKLDAAVKQSEQTTGEVTRLYENIQGGNPDAGEVFTKAANAALVKLQAAKNQFKGINNEQVALLNDDIQQIQTLLQKYRATQKPPAKPADQPKDAPPKKQPGSAPKQPPAKPDGQPKSAPEENLPVKNEEEDKSDNENAVPEDEFIKKKRQNVARLLKENDKEEIRKARDYFQSWRDKFQKVITEQKSISKGNKASFEQLMQVYDELVQQLDAALPQNEKKRGLDLKDRQNSESRLRYAEHTKEKIKDAAKTLTGVAREIYEDSADNTLLRSDLDGTLLIAPESAGEIFPFIKEMHDAGISEALQNMPKDPRLLVEIIKGDVSPKSIKRLQDAGIDPKQIEEMFATISPKQREKAAGFMKKLFQNKDTQSQLRGRSVDKKPKGGKQSLREKLDPKGKKLAEIVKGLKGKAQEAYEVSEGNPDMREAMSVALLASPEEAGEVLPFIQEAFDAGLHKIVSLLLTDATVFNELADDNMSAETAKKLQEAGLNPQEVRNIILLRSGEAKAASVDVMRVFLRDPEIRAKAAEAGIKPTDEGLDFKNIGTIRLFEASEGEAALAMLLVLLVLLAKMLEDSEENSASSGNTNSAPEGQAEDPEETWDQQKKQMKELDSNIKKTTKKKDKATAKVSELQNQLDALNKNDPSYKKLKEKLGEAKDNLNELKKQLKDLTKQRKTLQQEIKKTEKDKDKKKKPDSKEKREKRKKRKSKEKEGKKRSPESKEVSAFDLLEEVKAEIKRIAGGDRTGFSFNLVPLMFHEEEYNFVISTNVNVDTKGAQEAGKALLRAMKEDVFFHGDRQFRVDKEDMQAIVSRLKSYSPEDPVT